MTLYVTVYVVAKFLASQSTPSETTDHGKKTFSSGTGGGASTLETSFKETSVFGKFPMGHCQEST